MSDSNLPNIAALAQEEAESRRDGQQPVGILLADVQVGCVQWLWERRIPLGKLTVLDGDPSVGKSTLTLDLAAKVSRGLPMPGGTACPSGGVVILTAEDDLGDTVRPRLEAAGADLSRIVALPMARKDEKAELISIPECLSVIEQEVERVRAILVVVDPLFAFLSARVDSHRDQDVRRALAPLAKFAERTAVAVLVVRHLNKSGALNPLYRGGGSIGIIAAVRAGLVVFRDPDDDGIRVLASTKANLSRSAESLAFRLEDANGVVRVRWVGSSKLTAAALSAEAASDEDRSALTTAKEFLRVVLSDGTRPAKDVYNEADGAGLSKRTIDRAKAALGIRSQKLSREGPWVWVLPEEARPATEPAAPHEARSEPAAPREPASEPLAPLARLAPLATFTEGAAERVGSELADGQECQPPSIGTLEGRRQVTADEQDRNVKAGKCALCGIRRHGFGLYVCYRCHDRFPKWKKGEVVYVDGPRRVAKLVPLADGPVAPDLGPGQASP